MPHLPAPLCRGVFAQQLLVAVNANEFTVVAHNHRPAAVSSGNLVSAAAIFNEAFGVYSAQFALGDDLKIRAQGREQRCLPSNASLDYVAVSPVNAAVSFDEPIVEVICSIGVHRERPS